MADPKPRQAIRRFDVFAEYQRVKAVEKEKMAADVAKGYGIWLAKLVAARKFAKQRDKDAGKDARETGKKGEKEPEELVDNKWRTLDDEPQTDDLFEKQIIQRMGDDFYREVFSPAIREAYEAGKDYMDIRDTIRKDWKPAK
jgi:hypothetical protein